jgi:nucleotidyltransferase substrate binding protein (TIGR01987 family)
MSFYLQLETLSKSCHSLQEALNQPKNDFLRDSVIQRFEYCYELSWKAIRKQMQEEVGAASVESISRKDLFRLAKGQKLIIDLPLWFSAHEARNLSSHTYSEDIAEKVYLVARDFCGEMKSLIKELKARGWQEQTQALSKS